MTEFDRFASDYRAIHAKTIAAAGEEPEYFADYKMRDFAALTNRLGMPANGRYLDLGSGIGGCVEPFRKYMCDARLICADSSAESLRISEDIHGEFAEYQVIDDNRLDLAEASVDGAFVCCVFHHIPPDEHAAVLTELRRVLKPRAPLMIYEHNPFNPVTVRVVKNSPLDENAILISAPEMTRRCRAAGFGKVEVDYRVFFPAQVRWLRPLEDRLRWLPMGAQYLLSATH